MLLRILIISTILKSSILLKTTDARSIKPYSHLHKRRKWKNCNRKIILFCLFDTHGYFRYFSSTTCVKETVVNRACHSKWRVT